VAGVAEQRHAAGRPARERRAVEQRPDERLVDRTDDLVQLRVPALEGGQRVGDVAAIGPRLARPVVLLDDRDEVDQTLLLDVVVDEVPARAHPELGGHVQIEVRQALRRDEAAVGGAPGEGRVLRAEERGADGRVDAVGADQQADLDGGAVRERRRDAIAAVGEARQPVANVQALGRESVHERAQQVGAVHLVVREAEGLHHDVAERGPQQRPPVVPATLVEGQRPDAHAGQLVGQPEAV
jgi:hypothetical protein